MRDTRTVRRPEAATRDRTWRSVWYGLSESVPKPVEEYKALNDSRRDRVQEILVRNNSWMKDLSRDGVDAKKAAFKKDLEEVKQVGDEEDVDMEEA